MARDRVYPGLPPPILAESTSMRRDREGHRKAPSEDDGERHGIELNEIADRTLAALIRRKRRGSWRSFLTSGCQRTDWLMVRSDYAWVLALSVNLGGGARRSGRCNVGHRAAPELRWSLAAALGLSIWASIWRASSVNNRSPSLTLAPSSKCTETMVVSTRDFSATLEIGVTVPIASTSTGTGLRSALATSTETMRARCGPCALAPPPVHDERVTKAASAAIASAPAKNIQIRLLITFHVGRSANTPDGPVCCP